MTENTEGEPWLPRDFMPPRRVKLRVGAHLRPIRGDAAEIDYPAVMGSRGRLWQMYGDIWGWPASTMTFEADRLDLERHAREMEAHESFNYAILTDDETALLGCVYIDPPGSGQGHDALASWWVIDDYVGSPLEEELNEFVPRWLTSDWPFRRVTCVPESLGE
jgi:hypothetical protein